MVPLDPPRTPVATLPAHRGLDAASLAHTRQQLSDYATTLREFKLNVGRFRELVREYAASASARHTIAQTYIEHTAIPASSITLAAAFTQRVYQSATDVTDAQWERVASLLTIPQTRGRRYVDPRRTLNGIRYVLATGCGWNHMPARYGCYVTCWRRLLRWQRLGLWRIAEPLLNQPD